MPPRRLRPNLAKKAQVLANIRRDQAQRENTYREQALKLFPHVCGRCGREFSGAQLRELTVHHKDNDHMNNPPDGSNWELLCLYCHDDAHGAYEKSGYYTSAQGSAADSGVGFQPFEGLKDLIKPSENESPEE